ncbi:MAG: glycosyl hydrolase family 18 protein [Gammaproteobacteria bacterium]
METFKMVRPKWATTNFVALWCIGVLGVALLFSPSMANRNAVEDSDAPATAETEKAGPEESAVAVTETQDTEVLGWIPYWDQKRAFQSFRDNVDLFDYVSVFWYLVTRDGKLDIYDPSREDYDIISFAHEHGVKVLAVVTNSPDEWEDIDVEWDPERIGLIIQSQDRRQAHIEDLLELTRRMDFDGINLDYEALPGAYREDFSTFVQELSEALHGEGKLLAVAIHPKTSEDNPEENNGSHAQDWDVLSDFADQMHLMTYAQHTSFDEPGPAASPQWLRSVLEYAVKKKRIPEEKIFLGIPLYAEAWRMRSPGKTEGLDQDLTFTDVQKAMRKYKAKLRWSDENASPFITFKNTNGTNYEVWFENKESVSQKLTFLDAYGLRNVALWRLGGEDPQIWQALEEVQTQLSSE